MGEVKPPLVDRVQAFVILQMDNPKIDRGTLQQYVDQFAAYIEAQDNISRIGTVAAHPRTGAPIENPYLKVRDNAARMLQKMRRVTNTAALWERFTTDGGPTDGTATRNASELDSTGPVHGKKTRHKNANSPAAGSGETKRRKRG